jgi:hypothetical protein
MGAGKVKYHLSRNTILRDKTTLDSFCAAWNMSDEQFKLEAAKIARNNVAWNKGKPNNFDWEWWCFFTEAVERLGRTELFKSILKQAAKEEINTVEGN